VRRVDAGNRDKPLIIRTAEFRHRLAELRAMQVRKPCLLKRLELVGLDT
jgi:hypothetical protein